MTGLFALPGARLKQSLGNLHPQLLTRFSSHTPSHPGSVVSNTIATTSVEQDHAAVTVEPRVEISNSLPGCEFWNGTAGNSVCSPFSQDKLHDRLAPSRAGDSATLIVGVAAAADERGVSHPSRRLIYCAAGGRGCCQVSIAIEGNGPDGIVPGKGQIALAGGGFRFGLGQSLPFAIITSSRLSINLIPSPAANSSAPSPTK